MLIIRLISFRDHTYEKIKRRIIPTRVLGQPGQKKNFHTDYQIRLD